MSDELYDDTDEATGLGDRKWLLLALGGLSIMAITLAVLQSRMKPRTPLSELPADADWRVSIEHLAANWELRWAGLEVRLEQIVNDRVAMQAAAISEAPTPLGEPTVERIPPDIQTGPDNAPPGTAAVSM